MSIHFDNATKTFYLDGKNVTYAFLSTITAMPSIFTSVRRSVTICSFTPVQEASEL